MPTLTDRGLIWIRTLQKPLLVIVRRHAGNEKFGYKHKGKILARRGRTV